MYNGDIHIPNIWVMTRQGTGLRVPRYSTRDAIFVSSLHIACGGAARHAGIYVEDQSSARVPKSHTLRIFQCRPVIGIPVKNCLFGRLH